MRKNFFFIFIILIYCQASFAQLKLEFIPNTIPPGYGGMIKLINPSLEAISIDSVTVDVDTTMCVEQFTGISMNITMSFSGELRLDRLESLSQRLRCDERPWSLQDRIIVGKALPVSDTSDAYITMARTACDKPLCYPDADRTDTLTFHTSRGAFRIGLPCKAYEYFYLCLNSEQTDLTSFFSLTAFPNPFNPQTRVSFSLATPAVVSLAVLDVTGKAVASIYSGKRLAAGAHEVFWDGSGLASGIYLIQLKTADGTAESIKVTLLK